MGYTENSSAKIIEDDGSDSNGQPELLQNAEKDRIRDFTNAINEAAKKYNCLLEANAVIGQDMKIKSLYIEIVAK